MSKPFHKIFIAAVNGKPGIGFSEEQYIETSQDPPHSMKMDAMEYMYETHGKVPYMSRHRGSVLVITPGVKHAA